MTSKISKGTLALAEACLPEAGTIFKPLLLAHNTVMTLKHQRGFVVLELLIVIVVLSVVGVAVWKVARNKDSGLTGMAAERAGKQYSQGKCSGTDVKKLTHLPIDAENITNILPYGGVVGAHVMPISHGYIWPGKQND